MSFTISNKLRFIDSFQFRSLSLDGLVKNWVKDDFKYLNQEFGNNVLDLVKQEGLHSYEYINDLEKSKEKFIVPWPTETLLTRNMNIFVMFGVNLKWKQWKNIMTCISNVTFYCFPMSLKNLVIMLKELWIPTRHVTS